MPWKIRFGNLSLRDDSHTVGDFGRLPLLLPERDALNLKAFCPGLISPFGPGAFISPPPVWPGVFIWISPGGHSDDRPWRTRTQPPQQHRRGLLESGFLKAREQLHRSIGSERCDFSFDPTQDLLGRFPREFIRFGEQHVHRFSRWAKPSEHPLIELGQRVTHVHYQGQATQRLTRLEIATQQFFPGRPRRLGNPGVAVSREINDESLCVQGVEIDESSASRGLAHERQLASGQRVEGA